jgi:hypothetical protein
LNLFNLKPIINQYPETQATASFFVYTGLLLFDMTLPAGLPTPARLPNMILSIAEKYF